ncbi:LytR/AlgR family response regulator transcription factor [Mariniphaga sp.]|uniref:LytR/AlgR family response regulator transcription factor n=1 Tax=Mariniphaga sp. TaxID=1954475 RepID=UPI003565E0BB
MISQKIKSVVLDDNKLSRTILVNGILKNCPEIEIIHECKTIKSALNCIVKHRPDLIFIDIKMSGNHAFDLFNNLEIVGLKKIIISSSSDYAAEAFRYAVTDYLIKPVKTKELMEAVKKVQYELILESAYQDNQFSGKKQEVPSPATSNLVIYHRKGFDVVKLSDIIYCEASTYCTNFYISGNKTICSSRNLKYYEELLPSGQFMRVHHSFIINIQHVAGYSNHEEIMLSENLRCSLSGSHKHDFLHLFRKPE